MSSMRSTPFGTQLRRHRLAAGLSQERLAEAAGLSARGVSDLERGARTSPRFETVHLLADALRLTDEERSALLSAARPRSQPRVEPSPEIAPPDLPLPPTPLVGRQREIDTVVAMVLDPASSRLVTLTGPGGVGKTRLAIESATVAAPAFAHGARMVELAPLADPSLVGSAIAETLGIRETAEQQLSAALARAIGARHLLLVLDNFEHILPAGPLVASLLARCPHLVVLSTSRVPLGLRGERQLPVPPLKLPPVTASGGDAGMTEAEELFIARARDARPDFSPSGQTGAIVAEICRRLDGLPLALELAAVHLASLPPAVLLARLDHRLPLLRDGFADLPERQRTLQSTIAWSHDLLEPGERRLFRRLAAFAGGWTLDAAEAIAGADGLDVLPTLAALVRKSLVVPMDAPTDRPRYTMLETVREFALDQLRASGEETTIRNRHAGWCLELARAGMANLADAGQGSRLARLFDEQPNMRVALAWLRDSGQPAQGLRLASALGGFWRLRSANTEGRGWMETFLTPPAMEALTDPERVAALQWAGELAGLAGDMMTAESRLAESLAIARRAQDTRGVTAALTAMGSMAVQRGEIAAALPLFEEAAPLALALGERRQAAFLTAYLAFVLSQLDQVARAETLIAESRALLRHMGDVRSFEATFTEMVEGWLAIVTDEQDRASRAFAEAFDLGRQIDSRAILSATLAGLGEIALRRGQVDAAAAHYHQGLRDGHTGAYPPGVAFNLQGLVRVAVARGHLTRAARLAAALEDLPGSIGGMPAIVRNRYAAAVDQVRAALDDHTLRAETAHGRSLRPDALIAEAAALGREAATASAT